MPRVPKIDELQIGRSSIDAPEFRAVQGAHVQPVQGADVSRAFRARQAGGGFMPAQRAIQAIQASDQPARDQMQMGQAMAAWGDLIREIGLRESDEVDRARVQEGINAYMEQSLDAQQNKDYGWQTMQGANALGDKDKGDLATQRQNRLKGVREKLLQNLGNERQKEAFNRLADEEDARANKLIGQHVLRESERNKREQLAAGIAIAGKMMQTDIAEQRDAAFAKVEEHIAQLAQLDGLSGEALTVKKHELVGGYVGEMIATMIGSGDMDGANMALARYSDYMDGKTLAKVHETLRAAQEMRLVGELADEYMGMGDVDFIPSEPGDYYAAYNHGFNAQSYLAKLVNTESGGNNHARPIDPKTGKRASSAYGRAQFTDGTWRLFGKSAQGAALKGNMSDGEWLEMRSNPQAAEQATLWYAQENKRVMDVNKIPFNNLTAYLFHFGGPEGGRKLYETHPDTPLTQLLSKGQIEANSALVARTKTAGALIAYFAKKMGVEGNANPAIGTPAKPRSLGAQEARAMVAADPRLANNPRLQEQVLTQIHRRQNEREADDKAQKDEAFLTASQALSRSNGDLTQVPPQALAALDDADRLRLEQSALDIKRHNDAMIEAENTAYMLALTAKENLAKLTEADIAREWTDGKISTNQYEQLTKLHRAYLESAEREKAGGKSAVFDFDDDVYSKVRLYDRIQQLTGIDKRDTLNPEQEAQLERIELYAKQEGQRILQASMAAGRPFDVEAFEAALMRIMREQFKTGETSWTGSAKTAPLYKIPVGDAAFTSILDEAEGLDEARQYAPSPVPDPFMQEYISPYDDGYFAR